MVGCAAGGLTENDQDIYRFSVSPEQAGQAFTLVLDGVPNALTKAELLRVHGADHPIMVTVPVQIANGQVTTDVHFAVPACTALGSAPTR